MATFMRDYSFNLFHSVAVEADNEDEAREIFDALEHCDNAWQYLSAEVFEHMSEWLDNFWKDVVGNIQSEGNVYQDEDFCDEVIDYEQYL